MPRWAFYLGHFQNYSLACSFCLELEDSLLIFLQLHLGFGKSVGFYFKYRAGTKPAMFVLFWTFSIKFWSIFCIKFIHFTIDISGCKNIPQYHLLLQPNSSNTLHILLGSFRLDFTGQNVLVQNVLDWNSWHRKVISASWVNTWLWLAAGCQLNPDNRHLLSSSSETLLKFRLWKVQDCCDMKKKSEC